MLVYNKNKNEYVKIMRKAKGGRVISTTPIKEHATDIQDASIFDLLEWLHEDDSNWICVDKEELIMKRITFRYADALSNWEWRTQSCTVESVEECKRIYGLDNGDVEYEIISVEEVE